jgi:hypothetical protein
LGLWSIWRRFVKKTSKNKSDQDIVFPQSKGKVSLETIRNELREVEDIVFKSVFIGNEQLTFIYPESMVEPSTFNRLVTEPLRENQNNVELSLLTNGVLIKEDELPKAIYEILKGNTIVLFQSKKKVIILNTFSAATRAITPPDTESTVLGPQDAFVESLNTNLSLIRRRINNPKLKIKKMTVGTETRQSLAILYMDHIANKENVERVIYRVNNIEYHGFTGLAVLKQMLEDKPYSPFPQFGITVRPDNTVGSLLDGRIIVILDGSPEAAICPASFLETFNSPEDFYNRWTTATLLRNLRFAGVFITVLLTSTYVSVLTFHPEMLPPQMLAILSESRAKVPFPPIIEVLLIEITIEILREAGARMPTKIGQTIGIVGGIVIGTAAVEAGLASNILIVIVALSALLSFLPSNFLMTNGLRFVRYGFIIMAGWLGMFGQMITLAFLWAHLSNMTSLGSPYIAPGIPRKWTDLMNSTFRAPINYIMTRTGISRTQKDLTRPTDEE